MNAPMKLSKYRKKRDFKQTREPVGRHLRARTKKKLFVIQKHAASHLHYDFRLELNGVLLSWAIPKGPCFDPSIKRLAVHVEDHPIEYGSFEGIIPQGQYGAGTVLLWDKGAWFSEDKDPVKSYYDGNMTFRLEAKKCHGKWKLIRIKNDDKTWLLIKIKDEFSKSLKEYDITIEEPNSVKSHPSSLPEMTKHDLTASVFPKVIYPELCTLVDTPPTGKEWLHEIKFDGYRLIAYKKNNQIQLKTRNNNDWTNSFSSIVNELQKLPVKNAIFDGEIVVLDENHYPNFQLLQNSIKGETNKPFIYYIFDLLYYEKYDLTKLPLIERKKILHQIIPSEGAILRYSDHIAGSGKSVIKKIGQMGLEGIISKNSHSAYIQKRTKDWLKIKCNKSQEFIIAGFTQPQGQRSYFGALLLGTYNKRKKLIYCGQVGTGFTESSLKHIYQLLIQNKTQEMPFNNKPPGSKKITWVKPILVAEVEFINWTEDGLLRHPSFKGLRDDKATSNMTKEMMIPVADIQTKPVDKTNLTNPNKILYPQDKFTKRDIADYYASIQQWLLPYITERPLTLVRCPNGYEHCFFQKHMNETSPSALRGITIKEKAVNKKYIYIDDYEGLMTLPQLGVLEIHTWGSRIQDLEYPDMIIFDLDPAPDVSWKQLVLSAFEIKKYLSDYHLRSFVKTTGGKGLHIVIPIKPEYDWKAIKIFSQTFVNFLTMQHPDKYINQMNKAKRTGKIFVDYLRNQRGATAISPYSTRARIHAPVATPIHWDELTYHIKDTFYNIKSLPIRLNTMRKDPWKDFFKIRQSLRLEF